MDEVDRALAELKLKYGDAPAPEADSTQAEVSESRSVMAFRNLLSVDPKNLDSDAELRRFFGSKVVSQTLRILLTGDCVCCLFHTEPTSARALDQDAVYAC